MAYTCHMQFEWDEAKSDASFKERGFDFAYAARAFLIPIESCMPTHVAAMAKSATN